jgi:hypothetical protein
VAVAELQNFGASVLLYRNTLEQQRCRVDMLDAQDKATTHLNRAGCMHVVDKDGDGSHPQIVTYPAQRA